MAPESGGTAPTGEPQPHESQHPPTWSEQSPPEPSQKEGSASSPEGHPSEPAQPPAYPDQPTEPPEPSDRTTQAKPTYPTEPPPQGYPPQPPQEYPPQPPQGYPPQPPQGYPPQPPQGYPPQPPQGYPPQPPQGYPPQPPQGYPPQPPQEYPPQPPQGYPPQPPQPPQGYPPQPPQEYPPQPPQEYPPQPPQEYPPQPPQGYPPQPPQGYPPQPPQGYPPQPPQEYPPQPPQEYPPQPPQEYPPQPPQEYPPQPPQGYPPQPGQPKPDAPEGPAAILDALKEMAANAKADAGVKQTTSDALKEDIAKLESAYADVTKTVETYKNGRSALKQQLSEARDWEKGPKPKDIIEAVADARRTQLDGVWKTVNDAVTALEGQRDARRQALLAAHHKHLDAEEARAKAGVAFDAIKQRQTDLTDRLKRLVELQMEAQDAERAEDAYVRLLEYRRILALVRNDLLPVEEYREALEAEWRNVARAQEALRKATIELTQAESAFDLAKTSYEQQDKSRMEETLKRVPPATSEPGTTSSAA